MLYTHKRRKNEKRCIRMACHFSFHHIANKKFQLRHDVQNSLKKGFSLDRTNFLVNLYWSFDGTYWVTARCVTIAITIPPVQYILEVVCIGGCQVVVAKWQSTGRPGSFSGNYCMAPSFPLIFHFRATKSLYVHTLQKLLSWSNLDVVTPVSGV